jgi:hypothetical protein
LVPPDHPSRLELIEAADVATLKAEGLGATEITVDVIVHSGWSVLRHRRARHEQVIELTNYLRPSCPNTQAVVVRQ